MSKTESLTYSYEPQPQRLHNFQAFKLSRFQDFKLSNIQAFKTNIFGIYFFIVEKLLIQAYVRAVVRSLTEAQFKLHKN
jgi:hypothetical protein